MTWSFSFYTLMMLLTCELLCSAIINGKIRGINDILVESVVLFLCILLWPAIWAAALTAYIMEKK